MTFRIQYVIPRILGAFAKLRKAIIRFVASDYPSVQRFSNFFQVGTTFISQNVLRTTLLLGL